MKDRCLSSIELCFVRKIPVKRCLDRRTHDINIKSEAFDLMIVGAMVELCLQLAKMSVVCELQKPVAMRDEWTRWGKWIFLSLSDLRPRSIHDEPLSP